MQDSEIIELYFKRDEQAISETDEKYGRYLSSVASNILEDIFDSQECVNDTYLKAWNSIPPTYPKRLLAFLSKITRNLALDRYRTKSSEKRGGRVPTSLDELCECVGEGESEAFGEMWAKELGRMISEHLRGRSALERGVFIARYFYQKSLREIAKQYKISEGHAKILLYRGRDALRKFLEKEGVNI